MSFVFSLGILFLAFLLQILILLYIPIWGSAPELVLLTLLFFSLKHGSLFGEIYGFISGLLLDCFTISVFGLRAFIFTSIGYFVGKFSHKLDEDKIQVQVLVTILAVVFYYLTNNIFSNLLLGSSINIDLFKLVFIIIYNSAVSPGMFLLLKKILTVVIG